MSDSAVIGNLKYWDWFTDEDSLYSMRKRQRSLTGITRHEIEPYASWLVGLRKKLAEQFLRHPV